MNIQSYIILLENKYNILLDKKLLRIPAGDLGESGLLANVEREKYRNTHF